MKKYLQIIIILGLFGILVFFRQLKGSETQPVVGNQNNANGSIGTQQPTASQQQNTPSPGGSSPTYKDGRYTGTVADAFYGNVQVQVIITGGKITDVQFLQYPNDASTSRFINSQAMPLLKQETLQAQSAQVDVVSGASATSGAFQQSLSSALQQAS